MKKWIIIAVVVGVLFLAAGAVGAVALARSVLDGRGIFDRMNMDEVMPGPRSMNSDDNGRWDMPMMHPGGPGRPGRGGPGGWMGAQCGEDGENCPDREVMHQAMLAAMADQLGMSAEDLQTRLDDGERMRDIAEEQGLEDDAFRDAMQAARVEAIDSLVASGELTEEQAEFLKEHAPMLRMADRMMDICGEDGENCPDREVIHTAVTAAMADQLDMSADDLQARLDDGDRMWEVAEEQGMDEDEFRAAMQAARIEAIDSLVASGELTEEQGEWLKEHKPMMRMGQRMFGRGGYGPFGSDATDDPDN